SQFSFSAIRSDSCSSHHPSTRQIVRPIEQFVITLLSTRLYCDCFSDEIMNLGLRTLLIVMAAVTCIASQGRAQEIQVSHESAGRILQIEHAEVLIPPSNTSLPTMYLTIWNGTAFSENLVGVESDS